MKTELFDETHEGDPTELALLLKETRIFSIELSPIKNDRTCKISLGILDVLLSIDDLKEIINAL